MRCTTEVVVVVGGGRSFVNEYAELNAKNTLRESMALSVVRHVYCCSWAIPFDLSNPVTGI